MSLFGTFEDSTSSPNNTKSSLFDEEPSKPKTTQASGLFAEDPVDETGDSPWGFQATPKKGARSDLVKNLLPPSDVPESYIDAFDTLLEGEGRADSSISLERVRTVLDGSGLKLEEQEQILRIVLPGGSKDGIRLQRGEFNVVLALIGLAQEEEELSLDTVDERRRRLPEPSLPSSKLRNPEPLPRPDENKTPQKNRPSVNSNLPHPTMRNSSFGYPDTDPWASPGNTASRTNIQSSTNGIQSFMPGRTTSTFTTGGEDPNAGDSSQSQNQESQGGSGGAWGFNSTSQSMYSGSTLEGGGGFGDAGGDEGNNPPNRPNRPVGASRQTGSNLEEVITVTALTEKEGMFLFQYRNYEVASSRRGSKVIRRYSDFVWLLDCLHKRYPFRQLPLLPPKRVAINGRHIAADSLFIEKRRRGLQRFANALVRHPILKEEQLVVMFFTVPTELVVWRKQANLTVQEEFVGRSLPPGLEDSLPTKLDDLFDTVRSGVRRSAETYITLCTLLERLIKRKEGIASEYSRFSDILSSTTEHSADTYKLDTNDVPLLNEGINSTSKHVATGLNILNDEARNWEDGVLEDFKRQRDALVSMREMFDRKDRYAKDNIPQLERRIEANENKLANVRAKPDKKAGEAEKLEDAIMKDKESIVFQHARGVFIKECIRDEIQNFQSSQYHVSRSCQDWANERVKFAEMQVDCWRQLTEEVEGMPIGES